MDWFECKHRASRLLDDLRALRWSDPHQRRAILVLAGGAIGALLLIVALWQVVASATSTSSAEQAAQLNEDARRAAPAASAFERVRDVFTPRLRADNRFEAVLIRPGGSPDAPDAVATVQGRVADRAAFDALEALTAECEVQDAVHLRIEIAP